MTGRSEGIARALARAWVRLYTSGMPADLQQDRRAEIDADFWDHHEDVQVGGQRRSMAAEIVLRTVMGIPDDLQWRIEATGAGRDVFFQRRRLGMNVSRSQLRWMAACALFAGTVMVAGELLGVVLGHPGRVYTSATSWHLEGPAAVIEPIIGGGLMLLWIIGTVGFYMANRKVAGRAGAVGFWLLVTGSFCMFAGLVSFVVPHVRAPELVVNILIVPPAVVMFPLGYLLLGVGMPSPVRRVPLLLGIFLATKSVVGLVAIALAKWWPSASMWYRSDSPIGTATSIVTGFGLAAIGYSIWSASRKLDEGAPPRAVQLAR